MHCCYEGVREQYENVVLAIESNKRTPSINIVDTPCFELDRPGWNAWSGRNFWFSIGQVSRTMLGVLVELPNFSRTCDACIACLVKIVHACMYGRATALSLYPQLSSCELGGCRGYPTVSSGVSPNQTRPVINALFLTLCHIIYAKVSHVSFMWCGIIRQMVFFSNVIHENFSPPRR